MTQISLETSSKPVGPETFHRTSSLAIRGYTGNKYRLKNELYRPVNLWLDVPNSWMIDRLYEIMLDIDLAVEGMIIIFTNAGPSVNGHQDLVKPEEEEVRAPPLPSCRAAGNHVRLEGSERV